jgi:endonuclease/exonuclease/phosphatase family metal-dependent hydrolase
VYAFFTGVGESFIQKDAINLLYQSWQKLFGQLILNKNVVIQQNFKLDYIVYRDFHERKRLLSAKAIVLLRNKKLSLLRLQHQTRMQVECDLKRVQWPSFWPHWQ